MITGPLVEPAPRPPDIDPLTRVTALRAVGSLLVLAAVLGGVVWAFVLSPFSFHRLDAGADTHVISLDRGGAYVLFEEFPGASRPGPPPALDLQVVGARGRPVNVQPLVRAGTSAAPGAYRNAWHEGRAVAKFTVPRAGTYQLRLVPDAAGTFDPARSREVPPDARFAIGRDASVTWWASPWALLVLVVAPLVLGLLVLRRARRRRHEILGASEAGPLVGAR